MYTTQHCIVCSVPALHPSRLLKRSGISGGISKQSRSLANIILCTQLMSLTNTTVTNSYLMHLIQWKVWNFRRHLTNFCSYYQRRDRERWKWSEAAKSWSNNGEKQVRCGAAITQTPRKRWKKNGKQDTACNSDVILGVHKSYCIYVANQYWCFASQHQHIHETLRVWCIMETVWRISCFLHIWWVAGLIPETLAAHLKHEAHPSLAERIKPPFIMRLKGGGQRE